MKCSVFIATSADGYIATHDCSVEWLHTAGKLNADMSDDPDMGFGNFINSVDCIIMGRRCMEGISGMSLTPEQWPYKDLPITVLSNTITQPPENMKGRVAIYARDVDVLIDQLASQGFRHAYVDGGSTITSFIDLKLINEMTILKAPVLLGEGIPLFGKINKKVKLENAKSTTFPNDFVQIKYQINYD